MIERRRFSPKIFVVQKNEKLRHACANCNMPGKMKKTDTDCVVSSMNTEEIIRCTDQTRL